MDIKDAVNIHFRDIGQNPSVHDVTYENGQARERTQILMDIANKENGMVIGTGDLSELALGWATYNGDHMSMYAVNASVPKTLVRHLVKYYADTCGSDLLESTLLDVLDTPVSPELLPPENGKISQKTEDLVGPYELHDFFLYNMLRCGYAPAKVYRLARIAFEGKYDDEFILKWLKNFYRRFFAQQFKRSCLPDGPKVGTVAVSPRGDLRMPSDACGRIWMDEVDKLSKDFSGDPASALLEVLDPEQNNNFTDHYLNVPYDLSDVLFVCTANSWDTIPEPLLNRMEVIQFPGYTAVEKFQIARKHLLPKAMAGMGIKAKNLKVTDDAIRTIIQDYTAESGVRGLKKQMNTLCRYAAVKLVKGEQKSISVGVKRLKEFLGRKKIHHDVRMQEPQAGVVTGLAWTSAGGEILFIETSRTRGEGKVQITGQLGDVMKESVQIALTLVKSMFPEEAEILNESDIHIHVPAGATPKDGPSAGITLVTALSSLVTGKQVRPELGMTGEVSLRGDVMPIGGLPEKLMAAQRAGVKTVLIPVDNREDLEDVADEVKEDLTIIPVKRIEEVLQKTNLI